MPTGKVAVILGKCTANGRSFGIRIESFVPAIWSSTWAFAIDANRAKREGYGERKLVGTFEMQSEYPGCPYCKSSSWWSCNCGHVACWNGQSKSVKCPWCGFEGTLDGTLKSISVGGDG